MSLLLVLTVALLSCCSGDSLAHGASETILAFAGGDVILPCSFDITARDDLPTVEWSKDGLKPNVIFLYRDGCETYEMKNPAFEYRTSLIAKELKNGSVSLRISNVQLSDAGKYQCMRLWSNSPRDITTLQLVVGAASEPKLSVVSVETGAVTLQCEATCWLPQPEVMFLDNQGNNISAEDPKRDENNGRCFTVRRRVTLQTPTNSVTCRVHQPDINQTRDTKIPIPADCMKSNTLTAVGGAILVLLVCELAAVLIWKKCCKCVTGQKLQVSRQASEQSTKSADSQSHLTLKQSDSADNVGNKTIEQLTRKVADLESRLCEQNKITFKQNEPKPTLSPVVCQHSQPTIFSPSKSSPHDRPPSELSPKATNLPNDHSLKPAASTSNNPLKSVDVPRYERAKPGISRQNSNPASGRQIQRKHRNHSSPDLFNSMITSSAGTLEKMPAAQTDSNSESLTLKRSNVSKPQRRLSTSNRFSVLGHFDEESEPLMP